MSAMESLLKPRCLLLVLFIIAALPSASIAASSCKSNFIYTPCYGTNTYCCRTSIGGTSSCCDFGEYSYTSSVSRYGTNYAYTSCYNLFSYSKCYKATDSRCCYRTAGKSSSCCNYSESSYTSSLYRGSTYSTGSWIGYIVGGVIGGIVFLILIIVIPVVACGACAAASTRGTTHGRTTVVTYNNQPNQAYNNQGYNHGPPPPGYGQSPPQGPPPGYSQAPPPHGQMYPPPQQYPPPSAVDPAYPPQ